MLDCGTSEFDVPAHSASRIISFGTFEVNVQTGELRRQGQKVKLQEQPFQVLVALLERPGEIVTREELRGKLWPEDTFVDFDHSLNAAIKRLRDALGESADSPVFIETLARRGYRFMASVNGYLPPDEVRVAAAPAQSFLLRQWIVLAACIAALGLAAAGAWHLRSGTGGQIDSIAVLPFINVSGDTHTDYLSDGITESLIASLIHVPELKVKSRNSVFRYKGKDVDAKKVGNDLGVSALLSGRVTQHGENVEVSAELTDVRDNTEIWGQHYSCKSADIISLPQQIAGDIAKKLRSNLSTPEKRQVTKQGTQNPEAYELYLRGRYSWNERTPSSVATAISYFNQAIAKDPGYALAYSGLADAYNVLPNYGGNQTESYSKSNAAARRALELDATLARPHAVLAGNEMAHDLDFVAGEAEFKKALELDPNDAVIHQLYAESLGSIGGETQEAIAEIDRAHHLDPLSPIIGTVAGFIHIYARQYDEAISICKKVSNENPTFPVAHSCLAWAYWGKRMYPQVIEEQKTFALLSGDRNQSEFASAMEQGFHSAGWTGALRKGIEILQAQREIGYVSAYYIASLYADLGDKDCAFWWLNTAYREHDGLLTVLKTDFLLDPIRSDPRFAELVRKVGLPQ